MVVRDAAAPPTSWSRGLAQPRIDETASVHPFSNIVGEVSIDANVLIAPGTSIRADEGSPFYIGAGSHVHDGVVIHGLQQGRVVGDDDHPYSVWIGKNTAITHMALIHGPVYVGNDCFIGFRSTIFNARIGDGCIVMMHALIQDVEIPPGRYVPSGAIITSQPQADQLPAVQEADRVLANHIVGINNALRSGHHSEENVARITPIRKQLERAYQINSAADDSSPSSYSHDVSPMQNTRLSPEVVERVRQLLSQGLQIGTEHADKRRFQTSSWHTCTPARSTREADVLAALEACVAEHPNEYVRLFGIDTKAKRRVSEMIVHRPGESSLQGSAPVNSGNYSYSGNSYSSSPSSSSYGGNQSSGSTSGGSYSTRLSPEAVEKVRQFIAQGFKIGTEHADKRRFQTSSWYTCSPIQASRESEAIAALESCLAEHKGEYVRLFGIDPKAKRRVSELIIQRPGETNGSSAATYTATSYAPAPPAPSSSGNSYGAARSNGSGPLNSEAVEQVRHLLSQGYRITAEHADSRRFQTSSWKTCAPIQANNESGVFAALENCLAENRGEYVRLVGIDPKAKRRVTEMIIQRP